MSLVAILDADKEGGAYVQSALQLKLLADYEMKKERLFYMLIKWLVRCNAQLMKTIVVEKKTAHNLEHGITPTSIVKSVGDIIDRAYGNKIGSKGLSKVAEDNVDYSVMTSAQINK